MQMPAHRPPGKLVRSLWVLLFCLAAVWPIPNGSLPFHRNVLIYSLSLGIVALLLRLPRGTRLALFHPIRTIIPLLTILTLWILITGLLHSPLEIAYLRVFHGKWLRMLQLGAVGLLLVPLLTSETDRKKNSTRLLACLIVGLWTPALLQAVDVIHAWIASGNLPWQWTRVAYSRMELSLHINIIIGFLLAELTVRVINNRQWLPFKTSYLLCMLGVSLFCAIQLLTRNAMIGLIATFFSVTTLVLAYKAKEWSRTRFLFGLLLSIALLAGSITTALKIDPRWQSFLGTIPIALDTTTYPHWRDTEHFGTPILANGQPAEMSAYLRIAWIKIGLELIAHEPLGQGISGDNFLRLSEHYYGPSAGTSQAHSGLINFTIANGIPGIVLLVAVFGWLAYRGFSAFYHNGNVAGLFLLIFTLGFIGRSVLDDVLRDHMFEMFFLISGLLLHLCQSDVRKKMETSDPFGYRTLPRA